MIRIASPARNTRVLTYPAGNSSMTRSVTGASGDAPRTSAERTAYPSIAELSRGGISNGAMTSSASTRPNAEKMSMRSAGSGANRAKIISRASLTGIIGSTVGICVRKDNNAMCNFLEFFCQTGVLPTLCPSRRGICPSAFVAFPSWEGQGVGSHRKLTSRNNSVLSFLTHIPVVSLQKFDRFANRQIGMQHHLARHIASLMLDLIEQHFRRPFADLIFRMHDRGQRHIG